MRQLSTPFDSYRAPVRPRDTKPRETVSGADAMVAAARDLIARRVCTMLLIERIVRGVKVSIRIDAILVDGSRTRGIAHSGDPAMRVLCRAADLVLRQLGDDLPGGATDRIGLLTDGTGAVFSPERPAATADGWLAGLLLGTARAVELVPFAADGVWARLGLPRGPGAVH